MTQELATIDAATQEIMELQKQEFDNTFLQVPILKVGQALTREVTEGDAEAGEFINTLTGESVGTKVEFITAFYQTGRFAADESGKAYVAFGDSIPEAWEPLVGAQFVGTPFTEHPDAEEQYRAAVNRKERAWGHGPLISTTHVFTGFIAEEGEDVIPVRLSLKRTDVPSARKWLSLRQIYLRNKPFWEKVFELTTEPKKWDKGLSYVIGVKIGRETTDYERGVAVELAQAVAGQRVASNEAAQIDKPTEPDAEGGLAVG